MQSQHDISGRPVYYHSLVTAVKNVDVSQPILFDIPSDGVHISYVWSSYGYHIFNPHVHCSVGRGGSVDRARD